MTMNTVGVLLIVGSLLFWGGSFLPINMKLYSQKSAEDMLTVVQEDSGGWRMSNLIFMLGALVTAIGIFGLGDVLSSDGNPFFKILAIYGFQLGVLLSLYFLFTRMVTPESYLLAGDAKPFMLHLSMGVMTLATIGLGLFLRDTDVASWLAWVTLALAIFFIYNHISNKDLVPMFHYVPTLMLGIYLVVKS